MPILKSVTVEKGVCTFNREDNTEFEVDVNLAMSGVTGRLIIHNEDFKFYDARTEAEAEAVTRYMTEVCARENPQNIQVMLLGTPYRVNGEVEGVAQDYRLWDLGSQ